MIKHFSQWIKQKRKLHNETSVAPLVRERDLWWVALGENVGSEMGGKSKYFSRPALVLKKLSHGFYLIVPSTTQKREGSWYVPIHFGGQDMYLCLHHIRTIDYRRLYSKMGQVDTNDFATTKKAFQRLYF